MTEPVPRTSVRRTVRMAVALVTGQVALCAVIGWITFDALHPQESGVPAPVAPLAEPPLVIPPPNVAPPRPPDVTPRPTETRSTGFTFAPAPRSPARLTPRRSPGSMSTHTAPGAPPIPPDPATTSPTPADPQLGLPSTTPDVQSPVVPGDLCDPVDALGLTADGITVRCVRGDDGTPRWQIK